jgi:hypothetical protein
VSRLARLYTPWNGAWRHCLIWATADKSWLPLVFPFDSRLHVLCLLYNGLDECENMYYDNHVYTTMSWHEWYASLHDP